VNTSAAILAAYRRGKSDARHGKSVYSAPYKDREKVTAWERGWRDAKREVKR
jgi:ribosome modulation factor